MLRNYLITAIRNIKRHKAFSIINIMGLAVGIAVCIMVMLHIQSELKYDKFNKDYDRIFRIKTEHGSEFFKKFAPNGAINTPAMLKDILLNNFPEVKAAARIRLSSLNGAKININGRLSTEKKYLTVDPSFFKIFDYEFLFGNKESAMPDINSVVITEDFSRNYFGQAESLGKTINIDGKDYNVSGILKDLPENSHLKFNFLVPLVVRPDEAGVWNNTNFALYIKTGSNNDMYALQGKINNLPKYYTSNLFKDDKLYLQKLSDIHFYSNTNYEYEPAGNISLIYILIAFAVAVLLLACINFMNMSTARSSVRASEIGLRKTTGAGKKEIIIQFLVESNVITFAALFLAIVIVIIAMPVLFGITGVKVSAKPLTNFDTIIYLLLLTLFTGMAAGSYPAFVLSSFRPVEIIKKGRGIKRGSGQAFFRKSLIVFQFIICSGFIVSLLVIGKQMHYVNNKDLGYDKEQIVILPFDFKLNEQFHSLKTELMNYSFVKSASLATFTPGDIGSSQNFFWDNPSNDQMFDSDAVDADFFRTFGLKIIKGREFTETVPDNNEDQYILNETAVKYMKLADPIGVKMGRGDEVKGRVVGVVKDFHFKSLHENIAPLVLSMNSNAYMCMSVKINSEDIPFALNTIKSKFNQIMPDVPFQYSFFDEQFAAKYKKETSFSTAINTFSFISVFIGCLGVLGLVIFELEKRRREIGIRKILGANINSIIVLIIREFVLLILAANIIAAPIAYYALNKWLQEFAYRIEINSGFFILAAIISLTIAMFTIGYQTVKAATANPVDSIRYE